MRLQILGTAEAHVRPRKVRAGVPSVEPARLHGTERPGTPPDDPLARCGALARVGTVGVGDVLPDVSGEVPEGAGATRSDADASREGAAGAWRQAFLNAPYVRDVLVRAACISETFETAITWDRHESFHGAVLGAARDAVKRICGTGQVSCRFTHVYPDGAAPYFTVLAPAQRGGELEQWDEIKAAVGEVILREGGTITHHHAVGRDHRPGYDRQRPEPFAEALRAAKRTLDPAGILNPGVLIDP